MNVEPPKLAEQKEQKVEEESKPLKGLRVETEWGKLLWHAWLKKTVYQSDPWEARSREEAQR